MSIATDSVQRLSRGIAFERPWSNQGMISLTLLALSRIKAPLLCDASGGMEQPRIAYPNGV